ncbi:MAG: sulfotransferase, partial [Myxococcota bacterium]
EKIHLSKNPMYSGRVASLIEAFPDARFIINVRNPNETIPSLLKLVRTGWKHLGWDAARQQRCLDMLAGQASNTYLHPFQALNDHPEIRHTVVDYRRLISDPAATIEQIYHDLELTMSADFKEKLAGESRREKQHSTRHRYTLEEFGLDTDTIRAELSPLFERFEWDKSQGDS